jgi:hypothetical protein
MTRLFEGNPYLEQSHSYGDVFGRSPVDESGNAQPGYAHYTQSEDHDGGEFGLGVLDGPLGDGFFGNVLSANLGVGRYIDHRTGKENRGINLDGQLIRLGMERGRALGALGFDVGVVDANVGATVNEDTASIGAQANLIDGAVSVGSDEHNVRGGISAGVGFAGRAHYGDADGDGIPEAGFGADFGMFSFDVKSELLGEALNGVKSLVGYDHNLADVALQNPDIFSHYCDD